MEIEQNVSISSVYGSVHGIGSTLTNRNPLSMSQNFLTWHRTMRSLNSQFETKDVPLLHPGHQFLSKIWLRKKYASQEDQTQNTSLCYLRPTLYSIYLTNKVAPQDLCDQFLSAWKCKLKLVYYYATTRSKPPLPGQNRHLRSVQSCDLTRYIRT